MTANTVKVDRSTKWGNPFRAGMFRDYTAADAVQHFRSWAEGDRSFSSAGAVPDFAPLRGKNLACWCSLDQPCHADVLLEIANSD